MATIDQIFEHMSRRYRQGRVPDVRSYYFSIGEAHKYTVTLSPDACQVEPGRTNDQCDCVLKATEKVFLNLVVKRRPPGPLAIARGHIRTNSPKLLADLKDLFDFSGV